MCTTLRSLLRQDEFAAGRLTPQVCNLRVLLFGYVWIDFKNDNGPASSFFRHGSFGPARTAGEASSPSRVGTGNCHRPRSARGSYDLANLSHHHDDDGPSL